MLGAFYENEFFLGEFPLTPTLSPDGGRGREIVGTVTPGSASLYPGLQIYVPSRGKLFSSAVPGGTPENDGSSS